MAYSPLSGIPQGNIKQKLLQGKEPQIPLGGFGPEQVNAGMQSPQVGPGDYESPSGDVYDTAPQRSAPAPDFKQYLLPAAGTPENSTRPTDVHGTMEQDEDLSQVSNIGSEALAATRSAHEHRSAGIAAEKKPLSLGRKVAGVAAGVGMGLATMNPMAGLNVGKHVAEGGRNAEAGNEFAKGENEEKFGKDLTAIGGLYNTSAERRAQLGSSKASQVSAGASAKQAENKANEEKRLNDEVDLTEVGGSTPGSKQRVAVPKFGGANRAANPTNVGPEMTPAPHEAAGRYEIKQNADGTLIRVDKTNPSATVPVTTPEGLVLKASMPELDTYLNLIMEKQPGLAEAVLTFKKASAVQSGANTDAAHDTGLEDASAQSRLKAAVDTIFEREAAKNPTLKTDPQAAYTMRTKILNSFAAHPDYSKHVPAVQKLPEFKPPTGKPPSALDRLLEGAVNAPAPGPR